MEPPSQITVNQNQDDLQEHEPDHSVTAALDSKPRHSGNDKPIPTNWAYQLCEMICQENLTTRFSLAKLICRRCQNDAAKMGFARRPDNRACFLVNAREAHYRRAFQRPAN